MKFPGAFLLAVFATITIIQSLAIMVASEEYRYPRGTLPCKLFNTSDLDCTHRNLFSVPLSLPANVSSIDLSDNALSQIAESDFARQTDNMFFIDLSFNLIENITGSPFCNFTLMDYLFLSDNWIYYLDPGVFKGLINLRKMDLSRNLITFLPDDIFLDLILLETLLLRDNLLTDIPDQALSPMISLETLDLSLNYWENFTLGEGFKQLTQLRWLHLHGILDYVTEPVVIGSGTLQSLADIPITHLILLWDSINDAAPVIIEEDVFTPLTNITDLWTMWDLFKEVPSSLDSNLEMLLMLLDAPDHTLTNSTLEAYGLKWGGTLKEIDGSLSILKRIEGYAFRWFRELRILRLSGSIFPLTYIAKEAFYGLDKLEELYLARNYMNVVPVDALKFFGSTGNLLLLDLSYNSLNGAFDPDTFAPIGNSLTYLNVSHNPIYILDEWMNVFQNLQVLNIDAISSDDDYLVPDLWQTSNPSLHTITFRKPNNIEILNSAFFDIYKRAPNLKTLYFTGTHLYNISTIMNLPELEELDVTESFAKLRDPYNQWSKYVRFPKLKILTTSTNRMTSASLTQMRLNVTTPLLVILDLSDNRIERIGSDAITSLMNLEQLDLSNNRLLSIDGILYPQTSLMVLDMSHNSISYVSNTSEFSDLQVMDISGNPFSCVCPDIKVFKTWILDDVDVFIQPNLMYQCNGPKQVVGMSITEIDCVSYFVLILSTSLAGGLLIFITTSLVVRYRWHIRYGLFLLFNRRRKYQPLINEEDDDDGDENANVIRYDAFVSYAHNTDRDLNWVLNDLRLNMEEGPDPMRLCIGHARDFVPGTALLDAITGAIHNSRKSILVLSPSYLDSEWCYFETQHAWLRLLNEGQDVIILILLEPIPEHRMTMWLRQFLLKKGYLTWPQDRMAQDLFFRYLRELVKKPNDVDRRFDV